MTASELDHVDRMWESDDASRALGIELVDVSVDEHGRGHATTRMTVQPSQVNGHDIMHGGYIFLLADSTFALACNASGRLTVASGADVNFVASGHHGDVLIATADERATYGRNGITDVTVTRESDGALIAEFRGRSRSLKEK